MFLKIKLFPLLLLTVGIFTVFPAFSQKTTIETIIPNWGPPSGGTNFVVKGTNFMTGAVVKINEIDCATTFVDSETVNATSPNMVTPGLYTVKVVNPNTSTGRRYFGFCAIQTVYYISANGNDSNNGTTPSTPKKTIQTLVDNVMGGTSPPDGPIEIRLEQGTYKENLWLRLRVVITGGWATGFGSRNPDQYITILDGDYDDMCARSFGFAAVITLDGITMINGRRIRSGGAYYSLDDYSVLTNNIIVGNRCEQKGGAAYLTFNNDIFSSVISHNIIVGNRADYHGGGAVSVAPYGTYSYSSIPDVTISSNYIIGNKAKKGGGIWVYPSFNEEDSFQIKHNIISKNKAEEGRGGGILISDDSTIKLEINLKNNLIRDNDSKSYGGGLLIDGSGYGSFNITSNTITGNRANWFGDGFAVYDFNTGVVNAKNSIFYSNDGEDIYNGPSNPPSITYSDIEEGFSGTGNISSNPLFVSGPLGKHYLSQTATGRPDQTLNSPCLNTGTGTASFNLMDTLTTRTDEVNDSGTVDMGYHFKGTGGLPVQAPVVTSLLPTAGNFTGGDWVVIRGSGFREGTTVLIDNVQSSDVIVITGGKLLAEVPASAGGKRALVNVEVRNPDAQSYTVTNGFRYADVTAPKWNSTVGIQTAADAKDCSLGIILKWNSASDTGSPQVSYNVYRTTIDPFLGDYDFLPTKKAYTSDPNGNRPATYLTNVPDLTYLDTSVTAKGTYWYMVEAVDSADRFGEIQNRDLNGVISNTLGMNATTNGSDAIPPELVGNTLKVTTPDKGTTIHLDWMASAGAFKYNVYRGIEKNSVTTKIGTTANGYTTIYDDTPPAGTIFFYKIKAADSCNNETSE